jgi:hypothetical protein
LPILGAVFRLHRARRGLADIPHPTFARAHQVLPTRDGLTQQAAKALTIWDIQRGQLVDHFLVRRGGDPALHGVSKTLVQV